MPRNTRTHIGPGDNMGSGLKPKHLSKQEFARRLYQLMIGKGWHQSELARQSGLNRDAISTYINGKVLPGPLAVKALAVALDVDPTELMPNHVESAIDNDNPAFEMRVSPGAPSTAWLRVNRLVSVTTAVKIAQMLEEDDALNRSGSGAAAPVQPVESEEAPVGRKTSIRAG